MLGSGETKVANEEFFGKKKSVKLLTLTLIIILNLVETKNN